MYTLYAAYSRPNWPRKVSMCFISTCCYPSCLLQRWHADGSPWSGKTRWSRAVRRSEMVIKDCLQFFIFRRWSHDIFSKAPGLEFTCIYTWKDGLNLHRYTQAICKRAPIFTACWPKTTRSGHFCTHERVQILLWICLSILTYNISLRRSVFVCCFQKCSCCNVITTPHNALQSIRLFINPFKKRNPEGASSLACRHTRTTQWSIKTGTLHEAPKM